MSQNLLLRLTASSLLAYQKLVSQWWCGDGSGKGLQAELGSAAFPCSEVAGVL